MLQQHRGVGLHIATALPTDLLCRRLRHMHLRWRTFRIVNAIRCAARALPYPHHATYSWFATATCLRSIHTLYTQRFILFSLFSFLMSILLYISILYYYMCSVSISIYMFFYCCYVFLFCLRSVPFLPSYYYSLFLFWCYVHFWGWSFETHCPHPRHA